jgi:hypothetical protein
LAPVTHAGKKTSAEGALLIALQPVKHLQNMRQEEPGYPAVREFIGNSYLSASILKFQYTP